MVTQSTDLRCRATRDNQHRNNVVAERLQIETSKVNQVVLIGEERDVEVT